MTYLGKFWFNDFESSLKGCSCCSLLQEVIAENAMSQKNWIEYFLVAQACKLVRPARPAVPARPARPAVGGRPAMPAVWQAEF